jgi:NAD(P) transhydrogenase subunit beta
MAFTFQTMAYVVASLLFILSLRGLSHQETSRRGNVYGIAGMIIAAVVTGIAVFAGVTDGAETTFHKAENIPLAATILAGSIGIGCLIGAVLAARVGMTKMPQLVAILHSFVGLAAVLVGVANYLEPLKELEGAAHYVHLIEIFIGVFIGAITFTGSVVAWGKLDGKIGSRPLLMPGRHAFNLFLVIASLVMLGFFLKGGFMPEIGLEGQSGTGGWPELLIMTGLAGVLGWHLVMAIGGGDMPVVVSLLNSYSGWAAAAAGFMLENDLLIITGALVGSSGAILSYIMCRAMNRSIWNVVFGGFGASEGAKPAPRPAADGVELSVNEASIEGTAAALLEAKNVVIIPGYGMAVAQAQHPIQEVTRLLRGAGVNVRYAIHPVAGRLPGHMNVLLAEANVPYDIVLEMDEINEDFPETDIAVIVGANDIVNPDALTDEASPIYGMPVLEVWKADTVIMLKRGLAAGYAGIGNPLYFHDNTQMLFGDAKDSITKLLTELKR